MGATFNTGKYDYNYPKPQFGLTYGGGTQGFPRSRGVTGGSNSIDKIRGEFRPNYSSTISNPNLISNLNRIGGQKNDTYDFGNATSDKGINFLNNAYKQILAGSPNVWDA